MQFPAQMLVDYVRVYQRQGSENVGCNPSDHPTTDYINKYVVRPYLKSRSRLLIIAFPFGFSVFSLAISPHSECLFCAVGAALILTSLSSTV